jgi:hypothetical protein
VADHLSRLQFEESVELAVNYYIRDDTLLEVSTTDSWYANIIRDSRLHLWGDPYLYRVCNDGLPRRCIPAFEKWKILEHCHSSPYGGHYRAFNTNGKVWQSGFYWPTMYDDTKVICPTL